MKLLLLYGPPAVGKLTIAKALARLTAFQVFHAHLTVDLVTAIFPRGTPAYQHLLWDIRYAVVGRSRTRAPRRLDLYHGVWPRSRTLHRPVCGRRRGNRSGSENLTLAILSPHSIPCRHGNTAGIPPRGVGTDPIRSASLYSGTRSACDDFRRYDAGVASTAEPDLAPLLTSPLKRPALQ